MKITNEQLKEIVVDPGFINKKSFQLAEKEAQEHVDQEESGTAD